jgi:hypothetical protein
MAALTYHLLQLSLPRNLLGMELQTHKVQVCSLCNIETEAGQVHGWQGLGLY